MPTTFAPAARVLMTRRFADDVKRLQSPIVRKVENVITDVRTFGPRHPPLHTRRVERNPSGRFHFINVDDKYRIVAALEGNVVLFEKVGNHDATLAWGEHATLKEYEERLQVEGLVATPRVSEGATSKTTPELFEAELSLPQLIEHQEVLSDLITGDFFGSLEGYQDGSIEDWMIFLSPLQRRAVSRTIHGPARVSGGPGTGKTVVGLHRSVEFARELAGKRVLVTSYVRNVPEVLGGLVERLSPELHSRLEFRTVHSLAGVLLWERKVTLRVDDVAARSRFTLRLNADASRREMLRRGGFSEHYLWDEVTRVIEGREVGTLEGYLQLARHGRRQRMHEPYRRLVWQLYTEYREACDRQEQPILSSGRQLAEARRALVDAPPTERYGAIVVDEAQDLTECGMRLLLDALDGGAQGQILLIGDNAQRIYAGGFRLSDLGIEVRGRSFGLSMCYRSTDEIMKAAAALSRYVSTEDDDWASDANWLPARSGKKPTLREYRSTDAELEATIGLLRAEPDLADSTALLVPTNTLKDSWKAALAAGGIPVCDLLTYSGRHRPGVKVGTYNRAKGLEFKRVLLPNLSASGLRADPDRLDDLIGRGSALFVAMTRARDRLDLSYAGEPSLFIDALLEFVEVV